MSSTASVQLVAACLPFEDCGCRAQRVPRIAPSTTLKLPRPSAIASATIATLTRSRPDDRMTDGPRRLIDASSGAPLPYDMYGFLLPPKSAHLLFFIYIHT